MPSPVSWVLPAVACDLVAFVVKYNTTRECTGQCRQTPVSSIHRTTHAGTVSDRDNKGHDVRFIGECKNSTVGTMRLMSRARVHMSVCLSNRHARRVREHDYMDRCTYFKLLAFLQTKHLKQNA